LATAAKGDDYFNGCWVLIVDGTGTDNGFMEITDYVDATGDVYFASFPGTTPDATSRYLIVGAMIDCQGTQNNGFIFSCNTVPLILTGIGVTDADEFGVVCEQNTEIQWYYCGIDKSDWAGLYANVGQAVKLDYCGIVGNNVSDVPGIGGVGFYSVNLGKVYYCGISDNLKIGILSKDGTFCLVDNCFGDLNGDWGTYAQYSGQAYCSGTECSGTSGDHSNGVGDGSLSY